MVQYYSMSHKFHSISNYDDIFMCSLVCLYYIRTGKRGFRLLVEANSKSNFPCSQVNVQKHGSTVQLLTVDTSHLRLFGGKSLISMLERW